MYKIYSTKSCGYCVRAKSLLAANNLPFEEVYVDESAENFDEMKNIAPNMKTVPVITLNGLLVGGFYELKEKVDA
jgi:glutaredoxin|tara:strand:+ start:405 stop:629 length:225 start_codon:yes stop_codon:yes gene_type:complete